MFAREGKHGVAGCSNGFLEIKASPIVTKSDRGGSCSFPIGRTNILLCGRAENFPIHVRRRPIHSIDDHNILHSKKEKNTPKRQE